VYKLIFGAGGIYVAFIYYGSLQEDVFNFKAPDGSTFQFAWFLQFLEALANIVVGYMGRRLVGGTEGLPMKQFYISGATQVFSRAFTSLALAKGLSFRGHPCQVRKDGTGHGRTIAFGGSIVHHSRVPASRSYHWWDRRFESGKEGVCTPCVPLYARFHL
jgi:hypothetical protein